MKLKAYKRTTEEVETKYDLPVYLYFQDENCYDTLVMITEKEKITISQEDFGYSLQVTSLFYPSLEEIENNITTEEHFRDAFHEYNKALLKAIE